MSKELFHGRAAADRLRLGLMPARHRKQVADGHGFEIFRRVGGSVGGEELQHWIIKTQFAVVDREPHGGGVEALAERVEHVRFVGRFRLPPRLGDHVPVPHEHETVHGVDFLVHSLDEIQNRLR